MKTRFAPSPTGLLHLGNARTALFSVLLAMANQGSFLLRIEDTDQERSKSEFTDALKRDLKWLGLDWQEGPDVGGDFAPYFQSERLAQYEDYYNQLIEQGKAYPCFCTEEQLKLSRKLQRARGQAPRYAGTCRSLSKEEVEAKLASGLKPTLRFKMPQNEKIEFEDLVKGKQTFNSDDIGDLIIRRSNGVPSFMFCNAIDDSMMQVDCAVRGEDHLTNTPRQIAILDALGLKAPQYGHISLIQGQDGSPLSKRNGSRSLQDLREMGYLSSAVANHLARLGHYYECNDFMSMDELAKNFKESALSKSPAKYDEAQLKYWQKLAVAMLGEQDFWQWVGDDIQQQVPAEMRSAFFEVVKPNCLFPEDAAHWAAIFFGDVTLEENAELVKEAGEQFFKLAAEKYAETSDFKQVLEALKTECGVKGKGLFMPLRVALTGEKHGPEMAPILSLLGKDKVVARFKAASRHCEA